jgi:hypothetical protein
MTLGPDLILRLPITGTLARISTLNSSNNFGAVIWTDGRLIAPMDDSSPPLRVHRPTNERFWIHDAEEVAEIDETNHQEYEPIPYAEDPTPTDYLACLAEDTHIVTAKPDRPRILRMMLWHTLNDILRDDDTATLDPTSKAQLEDNLRQLIPLFDLDNPDQRLFAASAHRELRQFDQSLHLLNHPFPEGYHRATDHLRTLAQQKDPRVLPFDT